MANANMHAVQASEAGGPEVLKYMEVPVPVAETGEVLVRSTAIGVNFADVYQRRGGHGAKLPMVIGTEAAGVVEAVGDGVSKLKVGDRVAFRGSRTGAYAELMPVLESRVYKLPDSISDEVGAMLQVQGMTAHYLANDVYKIKAGDTCLIHAGAGGVGHILIQVAKAKGARVLTTVGTPEKAEIAKGYGADEAILYRDENFKDAVLRLTEDRGVDVVYDSVGETTALDSIASIAFQGTIAFYGAASGPNPPINSQLLGPKCAYITQVGLPRCVPDAAAVARRCGDLVEMLDAGSLRLNITGHWPLAEAADAHRALEGRSTVGKLILDP